MVGNEEKTSNKNGIKNGFVKNNVLNTIEFMDINTNLDLSNGKLTSFGENLELPPNLTHLKLSNNKLTEVPNKILKMDKIKTLDLSCNLIMFFDNTPSFCHTIEWLNVSNNRLRRPPFWVWAEKPKKITYLNLSNNKDISELLNNSYFDELLQYKTLVNEIDVHNCKLGKYVKLMATFSHAKVVSFGCEDYIYSSVNNVDELPCAGLEECYQVERMNLSNTQLYHINSNIDIYQNIIEINLSNNNLNSLPNEFCNLKNLETCIISCNKLLYVPDDMGKLTKLVRLYLDDNQLCMLPSTLHEITSLKVLDLYNNNLCEGLDKIENLEELDFALNYFEEPNDGEYLLKKEKLRINRHERDNGRKIEAVNDSEYTSGTSDDEELSALVSNGCVDVEDQDVLDTRCSSPEDWDSDDYWIPQYYKPVTPPRSPWLFFVKKKMEEGNFCPMDAHPVSIADIVKYEKHCNPPVIYESDGQFDDYSDDDS